MTDLITIWLLSSCCPPEVLAFIPAARKRVGAQVLHFVLMLLRETSSERRVAKRDGEKEKLVIYRRGKQPTDARCHIYKY